MSTRVISRRNPRSLRFVSPDLEPRVINDVLPIEVVSGIFELVVTSCDIDHEPHAILIQLLLVCRLWYTIARSTPSLWQNLAPKTPIPVHHVEHSLIPNIYKWFKRAGPTRPLHLSVTVETILRNMARKWVAMAQWPSSPI
ncbi:hypothetical protein BKA70DRAFT_1421280 [Coprinopsis sp. MPI-PUGE-AT-0042]|nr:hypothetical protein BKA70DRAFT_1421280 [Coprinopsis sp. MPI-PUGE-AT-0042]